MSDNRNYQNEKSKCPVCYEGDVDNCSVCATLNGSQLGKAMLAALSKIDKLTDKVKSLEAIIVLQNERIARLEDKNLIEICEPGNGSSIQQGEQDFYLENHKDSEADIAKIKKERVEECSLVDDIYPEDELARGSSSGSEWNPSERESHHRPKEKSYSRTKAKKRPGARKYKIGPSGEKIYKCEYCDTWFPFKNDMIDHQKTHTGDKPYQCNKCEKCFSKKKYLVQHRRTHSGDKPFQCLICENKFVTKQALENHHTTHTGEKSFQCTLCGKCFTRNDGLIKHLRTHTGEKPYKCSQCDKSFSQRAHLREHMKKHSGEKSHVCNQCGKCFARRDCLLIHHKIHTGEKPYHCRHCDTRFSRKHHLERHESKHINTAIIDPTDISSTAEGNLIAAKPPYNYGVQNNSNNLADEGSISPRVPDPGGHLGTTSVSYDRNTPLTVQPNTSFHYKPNNFHAEDGTYSRAPSFNAYLGQSLPSISRPKPLTTQPSTSFQYKDKWNNLVHMDGSFPKVPVFDGLLEPSSPFTARPKNLTAQHSSSLPFKLNELAGD